MGNSPALNKDQSVIFVTFSMWAQGRRMPTNGNLEPLRDFLVPRVKKLVLIDQPVPGSETVVPRIEEYSDQKKEFVLHRPGSFINLLLPWLNASNKHGTRVSFKVRDFLSVIDWSFRDRIRYDYLIGLESVNTLAGMCLRKLGRVKKVIYYVLDYSPSRYANKLFNKLYLKLDIFCATHADYIWDVSRAMQPARIKAGLVAEKSAPVVHVPIGVFPAQINPAPAKDIVPYSLVYMGTLGKDNGPDLAIEALPLVLKTFPTTTLHIIGGGEELLKQLKELAKQEKISHSVIFHGFQVPLEVSKIVRKCKLALAPYRAIPGSIRYYADASKMRAYAAAGVPIVTTDVPPLGRELESYGAAVITKDDKEDFAQAIVSVFANKNKYEQMRKKVIMFGKDNTWDKEFQKAFVTIQDI